jgi:hypothetical protein
MARSLLLLDTVLVLLLHAFCVEGPTRDATMGFYPFTFLTSTPFIQPQMNRIHLTKDYRGIRNRDCFELFYMTETIELVKNSLKYNRF